MKKISWTVLYIDDFGDKHLATVITIQYLKALLSRYDIIKITEVKK